MADDSATLLEKCRAGDMDAFRTVVEANKRAVSNVVAGMLGSTHEVADVTQTVFIKFYQRIESFRGDASISTYLHRIAVNASLDALRKRRRRRNRFTGLDGVADKASSIDSPAMAIEKLDQTKQVDAMLASLPENQRAVVTLRILRGLSTEETANILGIKYGTVLSRLNRALAKLRKKEKPGSKAKVVDSR